MPIPALPPLESSQPTIPDVEQEWLVRGASADLVIGTKDSVGALWWWDDLEGWFDSPAMDAAISPQGNADRAYGAARFPRKERYITIQGIVQVETTADLWESRTRLITAWDRPNDPFSLVVEEPTPKRMTVRSVGPIQAAWGTSSRSYTFSIPLVALDPAKYALTPVVAETGPSIPGAAGRTYSYTYSYEYSGEGISAGLVQILNEGNNDSYPQMVISGPIGTGWSVVNSTTGKTFAIDVNLNSGQQLVLDFAKQTATVAGQSVQVSARGDWWPLVAGNNSIRFLAPTSDVGTSLSITAYSSWK